MPPGRLTSEKITRQLARAGFPAARDEARQLFEAAGGDGDRLGLWVSRRLDGEPLEWIIGHTMFLGQRVHVERGVYVPRTQTEKLAERAIELLPAHGLAADLCTGSGAIAVAMRDSRPGARILATDIDPAAVACAIKNGVEAYEGHLADPIPAELLGRFDVVIAVAPYVPTEELDFLPRDVREHEPRTALDGGPGGLDLVRQVVRAAARLLHPNGSALVEIGGRQDIALGPTLEAAGLSVEGRFVDDDGDLRGIHTLLHDS